MALEKEKWSIANKLQEAKGSERFYYEKHTRTGMELSNAHERLNFMQEAGVVPSANDPEMPKDMDQALKYQQAKIDRLNTESIRVRGEYEQASKDVVTYARKFDEVNLKIKGGTPVTFAELEEPNVPEGTAEPRTAEDFKDYVETKYYRQVSDYLDTNTKNVVACENYVGNTYTKMRYVCLGNDHLLDTEEKTYAIKQIEGLDKYIKDNPNKEPVSLYRGMSMKIEEFTPGATFTSKTYVSFSTDDRVASDFVSGRGREERVMVHVVAPAGALITPTVASHDESHIYFNAQEREYVAARGYQLRVISKDWNQTENRWFVHCKWVGVKEQPVPALPKAQEPALDGVSEWDKEHPYQATWSPPALDPPFSFEAYSEDQARDELGRWTSDGGGGTLADEGAVPPNATHESEDAWCKRASAYAHEHYTKLDIKHPSGKTVTVYTDDRVTPEAAKLWPDIVEREHAYIETRVRALDPSQLKNIDAIEFHSGHLVEDAGVCKECLPAAHFDYENRAVRFFNGYGTSDTDLSKGIWDHEFGHSEFQSAIEYNKEMRAEYEKQGGYVKMTDEEKAAAVKWEHDAHDFNDKGRKDLEDRLGSKIDQARNLNWDRRDAYKNAVFEGRADPETLKKLKNEWVSSTKSYRGLMRQYEAGEQKIRDDPRSQPFYLYNENQRKTDERVKSTFGQPLSAKYEAFEMRARDIKYPVTRYAATWRGTGNYYHETYADMEKLRANPGMSLPRLIPPPDPKLIYIPEPTKMVTWADLERDEPELVKAHNELREELRRRP
jgi:hypothetical protein